MPLEIRTERLVLRSWRGEDAPELLPVLEANYARLSPWIPAHVATPVPIPELTERLTAFGANFSSSREWRYGIFAPDARTVLGEVALFPRAGTGRVPYPDADHIEIGYWLRADETGKGLITEAARAAIGVAKTLPTLTHVEIRCDARNVPSAAVPRRLGFSLARTVNSPAVVTTQPVNELQVWVFVLRDSGNVAPVE